MKYYINHRALLEQLDSHIRQFKGVKSITCLAFASLVNEARTVQQLIEAGADVAVTDSEGFPALHYACASDVDSDAKVAYLMQTATGGSEQIVLGPEVYSTSLRLAARLNQADRVRALIDDHGASVNATDERGCTALHQAAEAESAEAVNVLLQHPDCRVNATDRWDDTALHVAAAFGHAKAVQVLVQHPDCRVNATNDFGHTALHAAASAGHVQAVTVIVQHPRCDVSITDKDSLTAADWARRREHDDIAALIDAKSKGNFTKQFSWSDRTVAVCDVICHFALCLSLSTVYRFQ